MKEQLPFVIAIAGTPGSGKTTLCQSLNEVFHNKGVIVEFDRFEDWTTYPLEMLQEWINGNPIFETAKIPLLKQVLTSLKNRESPHLPEETEFTANDVILYEAPLGRDHKDTSEFIDFLIWIDCPRSIAFERNVVHWRREIPAPEFEAWLENYRELHNTLLQDVAAHQEKLVRPNADLTLDGRKAPQELAEEVALHLIGVIGEERLPPFLKVR